MIPVGRAVAATIPSRLKPYIGPPKLVIAFDIGTTFSGISYCILERGQVPEVLGVTKFPAQELVRGDARVPSLLYYDKSGGVKAAGAEVLVENTIEAALTEGWVKAEWHLASPLSGIPPLPPNKSAADILTNFVKYLFQCVKAYVQQYHPALARSTFVNAIEYIFTHPSGWEGEQQQLYRRAAEHAGLIPGTPEGRSRVHMLTEGEASLHYCVPSLLSVGTINQTAPRGIVIIDAGGGIIDLGMFLMTSDPVSCWEIAPAECQLQGSVFVTRRAKLLLEGKLEGWEHSSLSKIDEFTREFDHTTKLVIKSDQEPAYVRVAGRRYNSQKYNITFGKLRLTGEEATGLFNESFDATINAFEQQQKSATTPITTAFFVGGLSTNDWLWSRLQLYFKSKKIMVCRPDNHINKAVANGAVLSHVDRENHLVASRVARGTYGVICSLPVKQDDAEHIRRKHQWEMDPSGQCYIPGYFEAKIHRGNRVREEMELRESFSLTERNSADFGIQIMRLVCYRGSLPQLNWVDQDPSSFSAFCNIHLDLWTAAKDLVQMKTSSGQVYYQLDYDVIIFFGLTELKAELGWKTKDGERRAPAMITYEGSESALDNDQAAKDSAHRQLAEALSLSAETECTTEILRRDFASRIQDLEQRYDVQSKDLGSVQKELQAKVALIEEKDHAIAALTSENAQLKQINVDQTKLNPTVSELQPYVHYGVVCSLPVDPNDEEHIHRKDVWEIDPTGDCYVPGYFESKLCMGDDTREGKQFRDPFSLIRRSPADFGTQTVRILSYQGNLSDPRWVDEDEGSFSIFCIIHVDLDEALKDLIMKKDEPGEVYYQLDYDVIVSFGSAGVQAELSWIAKEGERRAPAKISYEDPDDHASRIKQIFQSETIETRRRDDKELEALKTTLAESQAQYRKELEALKSALVDSQNQLRALQRVVATADTYADEITILELKKLNVEVQQNTTYMGEAIAGNFQSRTTQAREHISAVQRVSASIGKVLANSLANMQEGDVWLYLPIALQAYFSYFLQRIISSWTTNKDHNDFISKIYGEMQSNETQPMSGRWRALTRAYISSNWTTNISSVTQQILADLSNVVVAASCATDATVAKSMLSSFNDKVLSIILIARQFNEMIGKTVSADFAVTAPPPSELFDEATMEEDVDDYDKGHGNAGGTATGQKLLCSTQLGMTKRMQRDSGKETLTVVKAKVVLESFLDG